jgi:heme A synthase
MSVATASDKTFRRFVWAAFIATALLIVVGGIVRLSDSGLGCGPEGAGLQGWPLCGGRVIPILDANMIVEYSHRTLASIVGVLSLIVGFLGFKRRAESAVQMRLAVTTAGLVIFEGILGGLTVEHGLEAALVAIHLGISMLILGIFAVLLMMNADDPWRPGAPGKLRWPTLIAPTLAWCTVVIGGYVAGTEKFGSPERAAGGGAHTACGTDFPTCIGEWFPFGRSTAIDWLLTHELFMYLTVAAVLWLGIAVLRNADVTRRARHYAVCALVVLALQVMLGALNIWLGVHRGLILAHLVTGTLLWLIVLVTALEARRDRSPAASAQ